MSAAQSGCLLVTLALLGPGCSCATGTGPGGRTDAGRDAGPSDLDTGARPDTGVPPGMDGGGLDAGTPDLDGGSTGLDAGTGIDGGTSPDGGGPPPGDVRFVVMGDQGEGNAAQREVATRVRDLCAAEGCDFVILLGDNFYDSGVESTSDPLWTTHFETPYADVPLPFYAVLGNHDYGGRLVGIDYGGLGNEWDKGPIEVAYTAVSDQWEMPDTHYTLLFENVGFVMLDTNSIMWSNTTNGDQAAWIRGAIADLRASGAEWIITAGHHPYLSNGRHGNAGSYEGIDLGGVLIPNPVPLLNGNAVRSFFDTYICGEADISFSGHDHNRQWIDEPSRCGGTNLIVSGAGAKTTEFNDAASNDLLFGDDTTPGFMYVVISGDRMTGRFVDQAGATNFEHEIVRTP